MRKEFTLNDGRKLVYNESAWTGKRTITIDGVAINSINKKLFNDGVNNYKIEGIEPLMTKVTRFLFHCPLD